MMAGLLQHAKFTPQEKLEEADIVILNTGNAMGQAIDAVLARLTTIKQEYPYKMILVAGSLAQSMPERFKNCTLVGSRQFHHIVEAVEETLHNNKIQLLDLSEMPPLDLPKIRKNNLLEIIPISRENIKIPAKNKPEIKTFDSYSKADIVNVAAKAIKEGVREIRLTSSDCSDYGVDLGTNLPDLIQELIALPGNFKISLDKCQPASIQKIKAGLFPLFMHDKMFKSIYIAIQSGSNNILKQMQLGITKEECLQLIQELRFIEPQITLAADVVVGYPMETDDDHWETLNLLRAINADMIHVSQFWKKASLARAVTAEIVARRIAVITDVVRNISTLRNERWKGWEGSIIIYEKGTLANQWMGRNAYYKPIMVEGEYRPGDVINVKITKAGTLELKGEKISSNEV